MTSKPSSREGYPSEQLALVRRTCLYLATKIGDILDDVVVVGGLVPSLLVDQQFLPFGLPTHPGTLDLDMGLALAVLDQERYRELSARLRDAGFTTDENTQGNPTRQRWRYDSDRSVTVDFLIPTTGATDEGGDLKNIEEDFAAIVTPGLEIAFKDRVWVELSGYIDTGAKVSREIPVCGPGAFTVLKALAFGNRTENKDAYELYYVWSGLGIARVASVLVRLLPDPNIDRALGVIERDFTDLDGPGPVGAARFDDDQLNDERQADVAGLVDSLLQSVGWKS